MNLRERAACDGLLDDDAPIADSMEWLREQCERLEWEIYSASKTLTETTQRMAQLRGAEKLPTGGRAE